jgi:hypothetical protein
MSMKRALLLTALASAMMADGNILPEMETRKRIAKKSPLSNKQQKARNKSKRAKKARK